jgi:hypothetical protein
MTKLLIALGGGSLAALATALTLALGGDGTPTLTSSTQTIPAATVDISGPCDEVEHANDPRCTGGTATTPARADDRREPGEDLRGPCDEAEHANDPRCIGGTAATDDDRSGPSGTDDDRDDQAEDEDHSGPGHGSDDDDRSGSNSGRG